MASYRFSAEILAPVETVYEIWTDPDRWHEWIGGVTKVTDLSGPAGRAGTRYTLWFGGMKSPSEILEADPPHYLRTRFGNRILRGETRVTFEATPTGTRLTQLFETVGIIPAIAARIFAIGSYKGSFQGELNEFVRIAEHEARLTG